MYRCVYAYCDPRKLYDKEHLGVVFKFEPFYIGKGTKKRVRYHLCPSVLSRGPSPKSAKILKLLRQGFVEIPIVICREFDNNEDASRWEQKFIKDIGRKDLGNGPLTNLTDGGEGAWSMSELVKIKRSALVLGVTEEEYRIHKENSESYCPRCKSWKPDCEIGKHYCRICWNERAKNTTWNRLVVRCGGDEKIANFYKESQVSQIGAKKNKMSLIDYYLMIQRGNRRCIHCGKVELVDNMFSNTKCRNCYNIYSKAYSKNKRNYNGRLNFVKTIVGDSNIVILAKKSGMSLDDYYQMASRGLRKCLLCGKMEQVKNMFSNTRCKNCINIYSKTYSKKKRNYNGRLGHVREIARCSDSLAAAIIQSALRQSLNMVEYAKHIASEERYCSVCKKWLPMRDFWGRKNRALGVSNRCFECWKPYEAAKRSRKRLARHRTA